LASKPTAWFIVPFLAQVFMQVGATGLGNGIYFFYQFFCHQLPERSFFCSSNRCTLRIATVTLGRSAGAADIHRRAGVGLEGGLF
jgi:hypothetical protein